jgi:hypothetical protein
MGSLKLMNNKKNLTLKLAYSIIELLDDLRQDKHYGKSIFYWDNGRIVRAEVVKSIKFEDTECHTVSIKDANE